MLCENSMDAQMKELRLRVLAKFRLGEIDSIKNRAFRCQRTGQAIVFSAGCST